MSCSCDSSSPEPSSPSCCGSKGACSPFARWLPFVLIVAATALYFRDIAAAKARTAAANEVRKQVAVPLAGLAISHKLEGRSVPFLVPCPIGVATNLLSAIAVAQPTKFPKGEVQGEELEIHLLHTNKTVTVLLAARLDGDPETLYVRTKTAAARDASGNATEWKVSLPVRVPDAGVIVGGILAQLKLAAEKLPPDAQIVEASTNAAFRAALQAAMTNNAAARPAPTAEPPAPAVEAN